MIKRFYVHNYRCLENFELDLATRQPALLIGRNGAGKSTVRSALEILQAIGRGTNRIRKLVSAGDFSRGRATVPMRFELEVSLGGAAYQYTLALELPSGFRELRVAEERFSVDGRVMFSRELAQVELPGPNGEAAARFLVDWHLVALPVIQDRSNGDPLEAFKTWLAGMLILAPVPSLMDGASSGDTLLPERSCANFGEWLTGLLGLHPAAYARIDGALKAVLLDFSKFRNPSVGKDARSLFVEFQKGDELLDLPFSALSDGEKCFFVGALVLAANEAHGPVFCLWDEPDCHLALSEVGHFVTDLRRAGHQGLQFIATSHNPETIRHFSDETTLLLYRHSHLEPTLVREVSKIDYGSDLIGAITRDDLLP